MTATRADLAGHPVELCQGATGEEHPGPLTAESPGHRAADRTAPAVDHRHPILQQHVHYPPTSLIVP